MSEDELHEQAAQLEKVIAAFRVVTNLGSIQGGFDLQPPPLDRDEKLDERISRIEKSLHTFALGGGGGLSVSGNLSDGYSISQSA